MRNFLLAALMLLSVCATAQVNNSFRGTLNVFSATGLAPNYRVTGFFSDANGYYSSDSCQVGDVIFAFYTTTCVRFVVDSIITKAGSIITADVIDVDSITAAFPFGVTAIMRETAVNGYPVNISGISGPLASCIETHFKGLIDVLQTGIGGAPGNSQDTIIQVAHGLSLLDPVHVDTSGLWIVSNVSSDDSLHMAVVTEVIAADTFIVTYSGITSQPAHGYDVGRLYYVQDNGSYGLTAPPGLINDLAFYAIDVNKLFITEQRPVAPMTDLNGIYATSDTVPSGTIATADNFQFKWGDNYYISFNPDNDNISMRGDSTLFYLGIDGAIITDNNASKRGLEYAASGYVTQPLSLTTKEYVDNAIAAIPTDNIYTADGTTIDANRVVEVINNISFVDTLTNEFGVKITTPLFSEEVAIGRLDATSGTKATLSESKNNIELRGNATDPLKLAFLEETAQGTNFSVIRARDTLSSNTDFILPNSNGSYAQVLTTDGQGRTAWDYIDSDNIQDGTITTADLAFTPLQGSGTSGQVAVYNGTNSLTSYATYTFNGTDNLTYYNTGLSQFTLGRFYLKYDSINTAQQLLVGGTNRILSLPRSNSNGLIIYPAADNSTTNAALTFSTGRTNVEDANIINVNTSQYINSLAGTSFALNITNGISQNTGIDVSNGIGGGIDLAQTWAQPTDASTQKTEYYGLRLRPNINRNSASNDNYYGIHIAPTLQNSAPANWRGIYNTTNSSQGFFLADVGGAHNYLQGSLRIGYSINSTNYKLHVTKNSGNYPSVVVAPANTKLYIKGASGQESPYGSATNYTNYPSIVATTSSPNSNYEMSSVASGNLNTVAIVAGAATSNTSSGTAIAILGHSSMQKTPNTGHSCSSYGIVGVGEYILQTAENGDTDLGTATLSYYGVAGTSKVSQAWSNGTLRFYAGYFDGNGINSAGGANATDNYGIYVTATGGTNNNWSIFSDDGDHYYEDNSKFGGSVAVPTARVEIEGAGTTSATTTLLVENSAGNDIINGRDDLRVALGNNQAHTNAWVTAAASTTAGASINLPAGTTPTSPQDGDVWNNDSQNTIQVSEASLTKSLTGTIFTGTADATVANTVTETTLIPTGVGTVTLPANYLVAGKTIKIDAWGKYETADPASTLELRAELGGTLLCTTSANTLDVCEGGQWHAEIIFTCRSTGVSGTTYSQGEVRMSNAADTGKIYRMLRSTTNTIDTTTSNAIDLTATHGAADTSNSITLTNISITVLN